MSLSMHPIITFSDSYALAITKSSASTISLCVAFNLSNTIFFKSFIPTIAVAFLFDLYIFESLFLNVFFGLNIISNSTESSFVSSYFIHSILLILSIIDTKSIYAYSNLQYVYPFCFCAPKKSSYIFSSTTIWCL